MLTKTKVRKGEDDGVTYKYDWADGQRWSTLIYSGRKIGRIDPGVRYSEGTFRSLYERRMLMGQAYKDARIKFLSTED